MVIIASLLYANLHPDFKLGFLLVVAAALLVAGGSGAFWGASMTQHTFAIDRGFSLSMPFYVYTAGVDALPISIRVASSVSANVPSFGATPSLICGFDAPERESSLRLGHRGDRRGDGG